MLNGSMIIEKITNSNGTAIKFEDGTMIQTGKKAWTGKRNFSWKGWYLTDPVDIPFATEFVSLNSCTCNAYSNDTIATIIIVNKAPDLTKIPHMYVGSDASSDSAYQEVHYIAIGTWK